MGNTISLSHICNDKYNVWCKPCQISGLKEDFIKWTSGNEQIDAVIQELQLKIDSCWDTIYEWIPYSQFNDIELVDESEFVRVYSATWKDGPLTYDISEHKYIRIQSIKVILKCLDNSQIIMNDFLDKVLLGFSIILT